MTTRTTRTAVTAGTIAAQLNEPIHRVLYVLKSRPHIRPTAMAGIIRLYEYDAVAMVRYELSLIDARRADRRETATA